MDLMGLAAVRRAKAALDLVETGNAKPLSGQFSFARMLQTMSHGGIDGFERETLEEVARMSGKSFDIMQPVVPYELLARDLTASVASAGGYLVDTNTLAAQDILRAYSVVGGLGVTVTAGLSANSSMPRTTTRSTPYWLNGESGTVTESTPALSMVAATPKTAGAFLEFSRNFAQSPQAEGYVRKELLGTVGEAVDMAVLAGTGTAGQPLGITNTPGIGTTTGTSLAQAGVTEMKRKVSDANAPDTGIAFVGTPSIRELLEKRERATGLGFIWDADKVASRPAAASTSVPTATLICAHWPSIHLLLWGAGFQFQVNPFDTTGFKAGIIQARVLVSCDVAATYPSAIVVASSIT
jgi:HK97 family phage major capsid protein